MIAWLSRYQTRWESQAALGIEGKYHWWDYPTRTGAVNPTNWCFHQVLIAPAGGIILGCAVPCRRSGVALDGDLLALCVNGTFFALWHGEPLLVIFRALFRGSSSVGRASRSQCEGRGFDPLLLHHHLGPEAALRP